jgi:glycine/D-amino acid oxidase-like deaminating enzyme
MDYIETYYRAGAGRELPRATLSGSVEADVCVVGGGLAGLSTALELLRRGKSVCLLEAQRIGWGASGRNGGFVSPGWSARHSSIVRLAGAEGAGALHHMSIEGAGIVERNIDDLAMADVDKVQGILSAVRYPAPAELQSYRDWLHREFGYEVEYRTTEQVRDLLLSNRYFQALYNPNGFHIHPLNYARALAREIERLGGRIFEATPAVTQERQGAARLVSTAKGTVKARDVVMTCGGYTDALLPALRRSYLPIATYVMLTKPDRDKVASAIRTTAAIGDDRRAGDYYRIVDEGRRILWGGKITTRTTEPRLLGRLLHRTMVSTYPQLRDLGVEMVWSGLMSYARHMMPQIGVLEPGLWYCTAFGGHGLNTTAIGGTVVAEAIAGESDRIRRFAPFGLAWNGGLAGRVAVQLTYWSYQAMDLYRERRRA